MAKARKGKGAAQSAEEFNRKMQLWADAFYTARVLGVAIIVGVTFGWAVYAACVLPVREAAGKVTVIKNLQNVIGSLQINVVLAWTVSLAASAGWVFQYRKAMKERDEKDKRIIELEKKLDPGRVSSGLTPTGAIRNEESKS